MKTSNQQCWDPSNKKETAKKTCVPERQRKKPQRGISYRLVLMKSHNCDFKVLWLLQPCDFAFVWFGRITLNIQSDKELWVERKQSTSSIYFAPRGNRQSLNIICAFKQCIDDRLSTFSAVILSRFLQVLLLFVFKMPSVCLSDVQCSAITHFWSMSWVIQNLWKYVVPFPCQWGAYYSH